MHLFRGRPSPLSPLSFGILMFFVAVVLHQWIVGGVVFHKPPTFTSLVVGVVLIDLFCSRQIETPIMRNIRVLCLGILFAVTVSVFGAMTAYVGQTLSFPMQDAAFASMDKAFGFDWQAIVHWIDRNPPIAKALEFTYGIIGFQIVLPIIVLACLNQMHQLRIYLGGMSLTILLTVAIGSLLPAAGNLGSVSRDAFSVLQFSGATPLHHLEMLRGSNNVVIPDGLGGMINFPSYHAAAAVFVPWTLRRVKGVFQLACLMNAVMFVSSVTEGGHYVCDVIAGAAIAAVAFIIATKLANFEVSKTDRSGLSHSEQASSLQQATAALGSKCR